jgi:acyl carrier protein
VNGTIRFSGGEFFLNKQSFLEEFAEIVGVSTAEITPATQLATLENWDSVSYLSTMVLLDEKLGIAIAPDDLTAAKTIQDIMNVAGPALESE